MIGLSLPSPTARPGSALRAALRRGMVAKTEEEEWYHAGARRTRRCFAWGTRDSVTPDLERISNGCCERNISACSASPRENPFLRLPVSRNVDRA